MADLGAKEWQQNGQQVTQDNGQTSLDRSSLVSCRKTNKTSRFSVYSPPQGRRDFSQAKTGPKSTRTYAQAGGGRSSRKFDFNPSKMPYDSGFGPERLSDLSLFAKSPVLRNQKGRKGPDCIVSSRINETDQEIIGSGEIYNETKRNAMKFGKMRNERVLNSANKVSLPHPLKSPLIFDKSKQQRNSKNISSKMYKRNFSQNLEDIFNSNLTLQISQPRHPPANMPSPLRNPSKTTTRALNLSTSKRPFLKTPLRQNSSFDNPYNLDIAQCKEQNQKIFGKVKWHRRFLKPRYTPRGAKLLSNRWPLRRAGWGKENGPIRNLKKGRSPERRKGFICGKVPMINVAQSGGGASESQIFQISELKFNANGVGEDGQQLMVDPPASSFRNLAFRGKRRSRRSKHKSQKMADRLNQKLQKICHVGKTQTTRPQRMSMVDPQTKPRLSVQMKKKTRSLLLRNGSKLGDLHKKRTSRNEIDRLHFLAESRFDNQNLAQSPRTKPKSHNSPQIKRILDNQSVIDAGVTGERLKNPFKPKQGNKILKLYMRKKDCYQSSFRSPEQILVRNRKLIERISSQSRLQKELKLEQIMEGFREENFGRVSRL